MERERYIGKNGAHERTTNEGLFGSEAVETAAQVEPFPHAPRRRIVVRDRINTARRSMSGRSGSRYLTPLAAFGAAAAMEFGMFAGGNLLLNYDDQISAFLSRNNEPATVSERAFASAVGAFRPAQPHLVRRLKTPESKPVEHQTEIEVVAQDVPFDLPDQISGSPSAEHGEPTRIDRENRFKGLEKIRDRQQKNLKEFLESSNEVADN